MISKKEYTNTIELQLLKKEKASLESKVFKQQKEQEALKEQVKFLSEEKNSLKDLIEKAEKNGDVSKTSLSKIKLRANIRDYYEFEEIEKLALDIMVNSQLQPVLITKDNYLISGHRRYYAIKLITESPSSVNIPEHLQEKAVNQPDSLVCYQIERLCSEISDIELQELQYAENNERRAIDNFQLSKLYNSYLEYGFEQKDLVTRFNKTKGNISSIIALKKIDPQLERWLKEFQVYAWSKIRYEQENKGQMLELQEQFFQNNKGIIGWKPLYNISKQNNLKEQKKAFLELFQNRLTKEELKSPYFSGVYREEKPQDNVTHITNSALKQTKSLEKLINKLKKENFSGSENLVNSLLNDLKKIENTLEKLHTI